MDKNESASQKSGIRTKGMHNVVLAVCLLAVGIIVGLGSGYVIWHRSVPTPGVSPTSGIPNIPVSSNVIGMQFSNFNLKSYSYLISGNATLSEAGKLATGDVNITGRQLANGSIMYSMSFSKFSKVYNVTISPSEKLYYIDTNLADDSSGADFSLSEDGYAVVNSTGYIINYEYPLPFT
jgi:hypothetical protein